MSRLDDKRPPPPDRLAGALQDRIAPASGRLLGSVAIKGNLTEPVWPSDELATIFLATYEMKGGESVVLGAFRSEGEARACCERSEGRQDKHSYPGCYGRMMVSFDVVELTLGKDLDLDGHPHFKAPQ